MLKNKSGFTLLEILLSVAIIGLISATMIPIYNLTVDKNNLRDATSALTNSLHRAETLAKASAQDSPAGVYIQNGSITVFIGSSYASRDTDFDEVFEISTKITVSGLSEIVFDKLTAEPDVNGDIILESSNNEMITISLSQLGMIDTN